MTLAQLRAKLRAGKLAGHIVHVPQMDAELWRVLDRCALEGTAPARIVWQDIGSGREAWAEPGALCCGCGVVTWRPGAEASSDPRGPIGLRVADYLVAEKYDHEGADVPACWGCLNNDAKTHEKVTRYALTRWAPKRTTRQPITPELFK